MRKPSWKNMLALVCISIIHCKTRLIADSHRSKSTAMEISASHYFCWRKLLYITTECGSYWAQNTDKGLMPFIHSGLPDCDKYWVCSVLSVQFYSFVFSDCEPTELLMYAREKERSCKCVVRFALFSLLFFRYFFGRRCNCVLKCNFGTVGLRCRTE